jgi:hypothetical protein
MRRRVVNHAHMMGRIGDIVAKALDRAGYSFTLARLSPCAVSAPSGLRTLVRCGEYRNKG